MDASTQRPATPATTPVGDRPRGGGYALAGVVLLVLGGLLLVNLEEDPGLFGTGGLVLTALGLYCVIVGAVSHGIYVARR